MQGLDRADRAALGLLLVVWEPLLILSIVSAAACMVTMVNWMRRYGPTESFVWVWFALTIASFIGVFVGVDHITQILGAGSPALGLSSR
jgi:hypothetical protein